MLKKFVPPFLWIVVMQLTGMTLGRLSQANVTDWYAGLSKSPITPPPIVFPIAWTLLYIAIAVAGYLLWQKRQEPDAKRLLGLYGLQLLLNWSWTPVFFFYKQVGLALLCILILTIITFILIIKSRKDYSYVTYLLTPYLLWLGFASYLNGYIWFYN